MPDFYTGDASLIVVHQAAGVLRELLDLSIERALRLLQVAADVKGDDIRDLARIIVVGASSGSIRRRA